MKKGILIVSVLLSLANFAYSNDKKAEPTPKDQSQAIVKRLILKAELLDDENIHFKMNFDAEFANPGVALIAAGKISSTREQIKSSGGGFFSWFTGSGFSIFSRQGCYFLKSECTAECMVEMDFYAQVSKAGEWRESRFYLIPAIAREVEIYSKRKDIELEIPRALNLIKKDAPDGVGALFQAVLPPEGEFQIKWRSHVETLDSKLVVSVEPIIVTEVLPGAVRKHATFNYSVIQGKLSSLEHKITEGLNILSLKGDDIQDWRIEQNNDERILRISLSREFDKAYSLQITAEKILPDFPCKFEMPRILPLGMLRIDGYLAFGTNKAVKLIIDNISGLSQVDTRVFPERQAGCPAPKRSVYTYRFSGNEYSLETSADNIMPSYTVNLNHIVSFKDEDMLVSARCSMDVKDAPLRELMVRYPKDLTPSRIEGQHILRDEYEMIDKNGEKWIKIPFQENTIGKVDIELNFERNVGEGKNIEIPSVHIEDAKNVRGYLVLAAARGLSLEASDLKELRKIHPGSVPFRFPGVQLSYKFKEQDWSGKVSLSREKTSFVSEIFHLATIGEGAVYGMSIFNYRVSGAPADKIIISLGKDLKNPEFTGGGIVDWKKLDEDAQNQRWQVNFREKLFGDYKLLATYELPLSREDGTEYIFGNVTTQDAEGESGFIVLASKRNLKITENGMADSVIGIETAELPSEYISTVQNPILNAYKFYRAPNWISVGISGYKSKQLIETAVDYTNLFTRIDGNGEIVTTVNYRIKNASSQFLTIRLPEKSELWTVRVDGSIIRVSSSQDDSNKYLIPIPRKKDTEEAIAVDLEYALKVGEHLGISRTIALKAPELDVDTMGAAWSVSIPENYNFTSFDGNMMTKYTPQISGLSGIYSMSRRWTGIWWNAGMLVPWIIFLASGGLIMWAFGRKKLRIFLAFIGIMGLLAGLIATGVCLSEARIPSLTPSVENTAEFIKLFSLPQDTPEIKLSINDMQSLSVLNVFMALVAVAIALAGVFFGMKRRNPFLLGISCTFLLAGLGQWLFFNTLVAFLIPMAIGCGSLLLAWACVFRVARRKRLSLAAAAAAMALAFMPSSATALEDNIIINSVVYNISASDKEVRGTGIFEVSAKDAGEILIVSSPAAITGEIPDISGMRVERRENNYLLRVESAGEYKFSLDVLLPLTKEKNGIFNFPLPLPECNQNQVNVQVDQRNVDITSLNAVSFKTGDAGDRQSATATFVSGTTGAFRLHPQKRNVSEENLQFFANIAGFADFAGGYVEISYIVDCQIAQGEIAKFAIDVPANMGVTSVAAPDMGAWRYSQETNLLEIFLTQPHHGDFRMEITAQIANCTLPYEQEISMLKIRNAGKQHGTMGISSDPSVQLVIEKPEGFNQINTDDLAQALKGKIRNLQRAFRYYAPPAKVAVKAVPVEPELRVVEKAEVSFEEERTVLSSDLSIEATKAGIFSVRINIPENFDIDQVSGQAVRHWDEISDAGRHQIIVHFESRMLGTTSVHLRLMTEKEMPAELIMPRVHVEQVTRHSGDLLVRLERGTRMETKERRGLELAEDGFVKPGAEATQRFSIIRPDWMLKVAFEKAAPWLQVENLQVASISDGTLDVNAYFNYKIENAGVKHFRVKLPANAEIPEFNGNNILYRQDLGEGVWEIELHKRENAAYRLHVKFRSPLENVKSLAVRPVTALDVELQRGFLVVMSKGSFQIKEKTRSGDITPFDARKIPPNFQQMDLESAVLAYRTVGTDYALDLEMAQHKAAKLLRANINRVHLASVVSQEGNLITRMLVNLTNIGNENFLRVKLPEGSAVWSVFIDRFPNQFNPGQAVDVAYEAGSTLVPLKQNADTPQEIEIIYSVPAAENWRVKSQIFEGPEFETPLNNVTWDMYLPEGFNYTSFSGTLDHVGMNLVPIPYISTQDYDDQTRQQKVVRKDRARLWLSKANEFSRTGKRQLAQDAFRNASNFALDDTELNQDIQGQWVASQREVTQELFMNRAPRRNDTEQQAVEAPSQQRPVPAGERQTVTSISDKIFHHQQAAASEVQPLIFNIPQYGEKIQFTRRLQMERNAPMEVTFKASPAFEWKKQSNIWAGIMLTLLFSVAIAATSSTIKKTA